MSSARSGEGGVNGRSSELAAVGRMSVVVRACPERSRRAAELATDALRAARFFPRSGHLMDDVRRGRGTGETLRLRSGHALRCHPGNALRRHPEHGLRLQQGHAQGLDSAVGISAAHPPLRLRVPNRDIRPERPKPDRFRKPVRFVSAAIANDCLASSNSPCELAVPAFPCGPDQPVVSLDERLAVSAVEGLAVSGVERQPASGHALNFGGCAALIHPTAFNMPSSASLHMTPHG